MGLILNPRGAAGSGKSELARRIMRDYGWTQVPPTASDGAVEPILRAGRPQPIGYRLCHPLGHRPLAVLGHYERRSGGCDTIGVKDGGVIEIFRLAGAYARQGHDVLIEGLALSSEWEQSADLARAHRLHVLALATPPADAAQNLARRRRAGRRALTDMAVAALSQQRSVAAACRRLSPHAAVHRVGFDEALTLARQLLRLPRKARRLEGEARLFAGIMSRPGELRHDTPQHDTLRERRAADPDRAIAAGDTGRQH